MDNPSFFLEGVVRDKNEQQNFEGPLSLILMLLSKNKIEIRDIKIADILDQYLQYIDKMQSMDLDVASEFVQMAAQLLYIKTKTLLSGDEPVSELEVLMSSLEQLKCKDAYSAVQQVVPELRTACELGLKYFAKLPEPAPEAVMEYGYRHEPVELLRAMYRIYSRGGKTPDLTELSEAVPRRITYSVRDKSRELIALLRSGPLLLNDIYLGCRSRSEVVATFISVLELCSMGSLRINREEAGFRLSFTGGNIEEIIESIVE